MSVSFLDLVPLVVSDLAVPTTDWARIAVIVRCGTGCATDDAFSFAADGTATRFLLDDEDGEIIDGLRSKCHDDDASAAVLIIDRDGAALNLLRDDDADPWFVPIGRENELADLVTEHAGLPPAYDLVGAVE